MAGSGADRSRNDHNFLRLLPDSELRIALKCTLYADMAFHSLTSYMEHHHQTCQDPPQHLHLKSPMQSRGTTNTPRQPIQSHGCPSLADLSSKKLALSCLRCLVLSRVRVTAQNSEQQGQHRIRPLIGHTHTRCGAQLPRASRTYEHESLVCLVDKLCAAHIA